MWKWLQTSVFLNPELLGFFFFFGSNIIFPKYLLRGHKRWGLLRVTAGVYTQNRIHLHPVSVCIHSLPRAKLLWPLCATKRKTHLKKDSELGMAVSSQFPRATGLGPGGGQALLYLSMTCSRAHSVQRAAGVSSGEGLRKGLPLIKAICSVCFPHSWSYLLNLFLTNNVGGLVKDLNI